MDRLQETRAAWRRWYLSRFRRGPELLGGDDRGPTKATAEDEALAEVLEVPVLMCLLEDALEGRTEDARCVVDNFRWHVLGKTSPTMPGDLSPGRIPG